MFRRTILIAASFAASLGTAGAQRSVAPDPMPRVPAQPGQGLSAADMQSLQRAARLSDVQGEAGRLAAKRATSAEIRRLAARIAEDHARFRRSLEELAAARRVELPARETAGNEDRLFTALRAASGEAFDRAFLAWQLILLRHSFR